MSVIYDSFTGDLPHNINYTSNAGSTSFYPDCNNIGIVGPLYLPRVYGSNLTAFEIASSGKIALSLNDVHSLDITKSNYINTSNYQNTFDSSNNSLNLIANYGGVSGLQMQMDAFSNNINTYAASNINMTTGTGTINMTAASNILFNASNSFMVSVMSNIFFNAQQASYGYSANNGAMYMTSCNTTNNIITFSSNNLIETASNSILKTANSNINIGALNGDYKVYSSGSNMFTNMLSATNITSNYSSNNYTILTSNQFNVNSMSNINIAAQSGDVKLFANGSNMRITMCNTNQGVKVFATSNLIMDTSNNFYLQAQSNINVNAVSGDINLSANSSNVYIWMSASNSSNLTPSNNMTLFASSNIFVTSCNQYVLNANSNMNLSTNSNFFTFTSNNYFAGVSNQYNFNVKSNLALGTTIGDITTFANNSNMYHTMTASTNITSNYSFNNYAILTSNNFQLNTSSNIYMGALGGSIGMYANQSNMFQTMQSSTNITSNYSSNNYAILTSNNFQLNTQSNVGIGALQGDLKLYANNSNTYIIMSNLSTSISLFAQSNYNVLASNNYGINAQANITLGALAGDLKLYSTSSNMFFTMCNSTNNIAVFSSNSTSNVASNSYSILASKNVAITASNGGSLILSANCNNMFYNMSQLSNNISTYASNNMYISTSNSIITSVNSNISFCNMSGSFNIQANNSNMTFLMDNNTNNISIYASNNYGILSSNNYNLTANSNVNISASMGDLKLFSQGSNMRLTMCNLTQKIRMFSSNDIVFDSSNNFYISSLSNMNLAALSGDFKVYSTGSNMFLSMTQATSNVFLYSCNNLEMSASNNLICNARSNITINASQASVGIYANNSNMSLTFSNTTNTASLNTTNSYNVTAGSNISTIAGSNINFTSLSNDFNVYARSNLKMNVDNSNVFINMNVSSNPDTIDIYGLSNINMMTSNSMNMNISKNYILNSFNNTISAGNNITVVASNNITIAACNNLSLSLGNVNTSTLGNQNYTASSNINFFISATNQITQGSNDPIFSVGQGQVKVNGDMLITGNINTSNIYSTNVIQQTLKVSDKTLNLASFGSNDFTTGGQADSYSTNDQSGIEVDGVPSIITGSNYNSNNAYLIPSYQKSVLWNYNGGGVTDTGTSNVSTEAYWEMLGGSLHLTKKRVYPPAGSNTTSNLGDVTFAFRINELDELEIVKKFIPSYNLNSVNNPYSSNFNASNSTPITSSSYVYKRVCRFGRVL